MGLEIERKFRVTGTGYRLAKKQMRIEQGFLNDDLNRMVRIRKIDDAALLTIKGPVQNNVRLEFEYPVPLEDAEEMLRLLCIPPLLQKTRYYFEYSGQLWEVDEFDGENKGLVIAEVELSDSQEAIKLPEWIGEEVTDDPRYYNANLIKNPFQKWRSKG
jgi:CYTH domain-containing protein